VLWHGNCLLQDGGLVMTSPEFNQLDDEALKQELPRLRVLARAQPLDKFVWSRLLQERGEVVAVTGDGTNDAPALKARTWGWAMGRAGTEVAKEASKIILLDDSFTTITRPCTGAGPCTRTSSASSSFN